MSPSDSQTVADLVENLEAFDMTVSDSKWRALRRPCMAGPLRRPEDLSPQPHRIRRADPSAAHAGHDFAELEQRRCVALGADAPDDAAIAERLREGPNLRGIGPKSVVVEGALRAQ